MARSTTILSWHSVSQPQHTVDWHCESQYSKSYRSNMFGLSLRHGCLLSEKHREVALLEAACFNSAKNNTKRMDWDDNVAADLWQFRCLTTQISTWRKGHGILFVVRSHTACRSRDIWCAQSPNLTSSRTSHPLSSLAIVLRYPSGRSSRCWTLPSEPDSPLSSLPLSWSKGKDALQLSSDHRLLATCGVRTSGASHHSPRDQQDRRLAANIPKLPLTVGSSIAMSLHKANSAKPPRVSTCLAKAIHHRSNNVR